MTIGVQSVRGLQSSLQTSDQVKDQVDEIGRRENVREGEGEGAGGARVLQLFRKVIEFASEQLMLAYVKFLQIFNL